MIAYLVAFVTLLHGSILGIPIGQVHQLLNILAGTMSAQSTPNPITFIKNVANYAWVDYSELVKIASLVCEHDIGLDLIMEDGCTVIEEIAARFLASFGESIIDSESFRRPLTKLSYRLQNEPYGYSQYHDVFPLVCTYARSENFTWRHEVALGISSTRRACDMLDRSVEQYIRQFNTSNLRRMLSKRCGIYHPDMPNIHLTYKQIGMMIPRKCQQMHSIYPRNPMPPVCAFLPGKTLNLLANISQNLQSNPRMDKVTLIDLTNSNHEFKVFHARHYIQKICEQAENEGNNQIAPACRVILTEHPEVMIPPAD